MALTLTPGALTVASAYPDPPFDIIEGGSSSGFDIELMRAICAQVGLVLHPVRYSGADFNGIFDGLATGSYDAVISGTTITPNRCARPSTARLRGCARTANSRGCRRVGLRTMSAREVQACCTPSSSIPDR